MGSSISIHCFEKLPLFCFLFSIFLINYILQQLGFSNQFSRNYLDDLLAIPIIFWMTRLLLRLLYRNSTFELDFAMLTLGFLTVVISFELVLPKYIDTIIADIVDVFCYAFGVLFYQLLISRKPEV